MEQGKSYKFTHVFFVNDMTSLRYAVPFIKTVKRLLGLEVILASDSSSHKYNSIQRNIERFNQICQENDITSIDSNKYRLETEFLYCVECVCLNIRCKKYYSFQHAFDYCHKNKFEKTYLVTEEYFKNFLANHGVESIVQPFPVVFWDWDYNIEYSKKHVGYNKSVTMFYPQENFENEFWRIQKKVNEFGFHTYVKQRRKHQIVKNSYQTKYNKVFYDDVWYPSESIVIPMISDISIGFETSAYTDLIHLQRDYIDFAITSHARSLYKPQVKNLQVLSENFLDAYGRFCDNKLRSIALEDKLKNPCDYEKIREFLLKIIL